MPALFCLPALGGSSCPVLTSRPKSLFKHHRRCSKACASTADAKAQRPSAQRLLSPPPLPPRASCAPTIRKCRSSKQGRNCPIRCIRRVGNRNNGVFCSIAQTDIRWRQKRMISSAWRLSDPDGLRHWAAGRSKRPNRPKTSSNRCWHGLRATRVARGYHDTRSGGFSARLPRCWTRSCA